MKISLGPGPGLENHRAEPGRAELKLNRAEPRKSGPFRALIDINTDSKRVIEFMSYGEPSVFTRISNTKG